jgi:hypothetical protein
LHPNSTEAYNQSDNGSEYFAILGAILENSDLPKANHMLALRCYNNMFKQQSSHFAIMRRRERIMASVAPYLYSEDKNVRQSAVTVLMNYSVAFLLKEDEEGRV